MTNCPHGAHTDHENRISTLEDDVKEIQTAINHQQIVAVMLTFAGTIFTGTAAFAGVVLAPVIKTWLGVQ